MVLPTNEHFHSVVWPCMIVEWHQLCHNRWHTIQISTSDLYRQILRKEIYQFRPVMVVECSLHPRTIQLQVEHYVHLISLWYHIPLFVNHWCPPWASDNPFLFICLQSVLWGSKGALAKEIKNKKMWTVVRAGLKPDDHKMKMLHSPFALPLGYVLVKDYVLWQ